MWNRYVGNDGGPGRNIPNDLKAEHSNSNIQQGISYLGDNVIECVVTTIAR